MEETRTFTTVDSLNNLCDKKYLEFINDGKYKEILSTMGRFVKETIENDVLIMEQMPSATKLYTKEEWEKIKQRELVESPKFINLIGLTLYKNEQGPIDSYGSLHVVGTNKLHAYVRTLYDISQTTGKEVAPEIDKETLAANFDAVKGSLEHTSKGYTIKYDDIKDKSTIDKANKTIIVQNGMSLNEVINELVDKTTRVLIDCRKQEGLTSEKVKNIADLEHKSAVYAIHSRYGLDMPDFDFREIEKFTDEEKMTFRDNLSKVRSVVYQLTHNLENSIDFANREKYRQNNANKDSYTEKTNQNTRQNQSESEEL